MGEQPKKVLKGDVNTKGIILYMPPTQHKKLKEIARLNKKSLNELLRNLADNAINVYERAKGVIEIEEEADKPPKNPN